MVVVLQEQGLRKSYLSKYDCATKAVEHLVFNMAAMYHEENNLSKDKETWRIYLIGIPL